MNVFNSGAASIAARSHYEYGIYGEDGIAGDRQSAATRAGVRSKLCAAALAAAVVTMAPGMLHPARAQTPCASGTPQVIIYHAGALTAEFAAVEQVFTSETGVCVTDVSAGSVDGARRISAGGEPCDIFAAADYLDIDLFLKPGGYADFNIRFAQTSMVLAYTTASKQAATIAKTNRDFSPPGSVPEVANDWYTQLRQPGVWIGGTNPFQDPSAYRAQFIFQLTETLYGVPNLYDLLQEHYSINKTSDVLGQTYDYIFTYESAALAAYNASPGTYRYARLPQAVNLAKPGLAAQYATASLVVPGTGTPDAAPFVEIKATPVVFGVTLLKSAPNPGNAAAFLALLFSDRGIALQKSTGPKPINPPLVTAAEVQAVPPSLQAAVQVTQ